MKNLKIITLIVLMCGSTRLRAQKVASSQKDNLRAPTNIKIDGKLTEWDDKLKAYSYHTQFYYTISNDNKYLYLTIQAKYQNIINRILKGGITLTVNKSCTRTDAAGIHITYPIINGGLIWIRPAKNIKPTDTAAIAQLDTYINKTNALLDSKTKFIKVAGVKGIDTLISIYNLDGIKAASKLDKQLRFNYELAVSLADLGLDIKNPQKFSYQVMINEIDDRLTHKPGEIYVSLPGLSEQPATDFWGEYTLAK